MDTIKVANTLFFHHSSDVNTLFAEYKSLDGDPDSMLDIIIHICELYLEKWENTSYAGLDSLDAIGSLDMLQELYINDYNHEHMPLTRYTVIMLHVFIVDNILDISEDKSPYYLIDYISSLNLNEAKQALGYVNSALKRININIAGNIFPFYDDETLGKFYNSISEQIVFRNLENDFTGVTFRKNKADYEVISLYYKSDILSREEIITRFESLLSEGNDSTCCFCAYYFGAYLLDAGEYGKCKELLKHYLDPIKKHLSVFSHAVACYILASCYYSTGDMRTTKIYAVDAKRSFQTNCIQSINTLRMLVDAYFNLQDTISHNKAIVELIEKYELYFGENNSGTAELLLIAGTQYCDFGNTNAAEECFNKAKTIIAEIYGKESMWVDYLGRYDSMIYTARHDYINAKKSIDKAYHIIHNLTTYDSADEFVINIINDKETIHKDISNNVFYISSKLDDDSAGFNVFDIISSYMKGDDVNTIVASAAKGLGLPEEYIKGIIFDKYPIKINGFQDAAKFAKIFANLSKYQYLSESDFFEDATDEMRDKNVSEILVSYETMLSAFHVESLLYHIFKNHLFEMSDLICWGYLKINKPNKALDYIYKYEDTIKSATGELRWLTLKCLVYDSLYDLRNTQNNITQLVILQQKLVYQILSISSEEKQLEFLAQAQFKHTLPECIYLLIKHKDVKYAYDFLLKNKTLTIDYIKLSKIYKNNINENDFNKKLFHIQNEMISAKLDKKTVLIEFTKTWYAVEKLSYNAFIVDMNDKITFVNLGDTEIIDRYIDDFLDAIKENSDPVPEIYELNGYMELYKRIALPLLNKIGFDMDKIIIAPEGKTFMLPFDLILNNIPVKNSKKYYISIIYSGKDLIREYKPVFNSFQKDQCLVIGDPGSTGKEDLPYSEYEARAIAEILGSRYYTGHEVKKFLFNKNYYLLHIAAHAETDTIAENSMDKARLSLYGEEFLTAKEISNLNFSNAKLVVLSGCWTGSGRDINYEGLLGLSRAFINAGARNIIVSLWEADDMASALLMKEFYSNWIEKQNPISISLENAKTYLKNLTIRELQNISSEFNNSFDYVPDNNYNEKYYKHPYYWANYVYIGFDK